MDFVRPFPEVNDANYLWVVICRLASMVHLIPVNTKIIAGIVLEIPQRGSPTARPSGINPEWQRPEIHVQMVERASQANQHKTIDVHLVPPTNGWTNRMNELEYWTDPEDSRLSTPKGLDRKNWHDRIRHKIECTYLHWQDISNGTAPRTSVPTTPSEPLDTNLKLVCMVQTSLTLLIMCELVVLKSLLSESLLVD